MAQTDRTTGLVGMAGMKVPCKAATTANITLSGEQTIDGIACVTGDRVLVKNQTDGTENGIYVVDTGAWSRAPDFDGSYDIVSGSMMRVNQGSSNGDGLFIVSTSDPITIGTTSLSFSRLAVNYVVSASAVATAAQTLFNLGVTYQTGSNNLAVFVNGRRVRLTADYTETSSSSITFTYPLEAGDEVDVYGGLAIGNLVAALATAVSVSDAGDFYLGTTVEAILQELGNGITPDNGDASATLTYNASATVQGWNTPLTANRTVTLSTANAKEGSNFTIVRRSGATGAFTLAVGSLCTLRAPGEWCEVRYDSGLAAWVLEKYGILPSAEILAMSADNGDASATLTVASSPRTQRWATALTAEQTAALDTTGAYTGARFHIVRTEAATGLFSLLVTVGGATLARLAPGQWCTAEYTGSTWILTGMGNVRNTQPNVVNLTDDFLGEELDAYRWQSLIGTDPSCQQAILDPGKLRGIVRLVTGADAGASMALNGAQMQSQLNWAAEQGGLVIEGKFKMSAITADAVFFGFTDQVAALEMPFTLAAGDVLTSNASNAFGVLFDTAADTDNWWAVGVAADVDAAKQNLAVAPVADTMELWRIEVSTSGSASFYRNGSLIGAAMVGAVTPSAQLTPVLAAFSRGAASRNIDCDFITLQAQR